MFTEGMEKYFLIERETEHMWQSHADECSQLWR